MKSLIQNLCCERCDDPQTMQDIDGKVDQFNLDEILCELGSFGNYQIFLLILLAFRDSFLYMCNYNYVFAAAEVSFRCNDNSTSRHTSSASYASSNSSVCPCQNIIYNDYNSIVAEFDLGCQSWKRTLIATVHNLGLILSFIISGYISDRYGRKVIIVVTPLTVAAAGLLKSFVQNYWLLLVLEFLESALGYGNASMILSLETVSQQHRVTFFCVSDILTSLGGALFGLIAWQVPHWRHMLRAIYAPLLFVVFYQYFVDEGVRWLFAQNRNIEAVKILNKVANINNINMSNATTKMLGKIIEERSSAKLEPSSQEKTHILSALKSKKIILRMALIAACFFCCMFVHTGAIVHSTSIYGNMYVNFSAVLLVAVPTRIITALTLNRFGRKTPICVAYSLCAFSFIASVFVPESVRWASLLLYLLGKMCSSYGIFSMSVVAMEVFPTTSRNSLTNFSKSVGRLGSVLSPQAPLLAKYMAGLPSIIFGVVAAGPAVLCLALPDTSRRPLPEQVADAETIDTDDDSTNTNNSPPAIKTEW